MPRAPIAKRLESFVTGPNGIPDDDPVEQFHEASRWYPSFHLRESWGAALLEVDESAQELVRRAGKRMPHRPSIALPEPAFPDVSLGSAVTARRSRRIFGRSPLAIGELSTLLYATYGLSGSLVGAVGESSGRVVPSAGALYPLDVYVGILNVVEIEAGIYHYDPYEHKLENLSTSDPTPRIAAALVEPDAINNVGAVVVFAGAFWRNRFKYGRRAYRFALLEAGHAAQNLLLTAEAQALSAYPIGGFYDRPWDELLGLDSVNESVLYTIVVGSRNDDAGGVVTTSS